MSKEINDTINPSHYKSHPSGIECIEISKHLSGCLAQAFQYAWRCGQKDDPVQELNKALWFIDAELGIDNYFVIENNSLIDLIDKVLEFETGFKHFALFFIAYANTDMLKRQIFLNRAKHAINQMIKEYAAN